MEVFKDYAYYYNAFYKDKDYKQEARTVDLLLKKYGENIHKIINYGCGTGKHDVELNQLGYECSGIDMSEMMIDIANQNKSENPSLSFAVSDIRCFEPDQKYDAVISLFHVMSYQNSNQDILDALKSARKCLEKGSLLLFDIWFGPGVLTDRPYVRVKKVEDEKNSLIRIARPVMHANENIVDVCYEVLITDKKTGVTKTINEVHNMRYFFVPELKLLLEQAGFEFVINLDCNSLVEANYDSWTCFVVAKAV